MICVDRNNTCDSNGFASNIFQPSLKINPCDRHDINGAISLSLLQFDLGYFNLAPALSPLKLSSNKSSIIVSTSLSLPGTCYCKAFPLYFNLTTSLSVRQSQFYTSADKGSADIIISGLTPNTIYDVYCFAESYQGNSLPLVDVLNTKTIIQTQCCASILLTYPTSNYFSSIQPFYGTFQLEMGPSSTTIITVNLNISSSCGHNTNTSVSNASNISPNVFIITYSRLFTDIILPCESTILWVFRSVHY